MLRFSIPLILTLLLICCKNVEKKKSPHVSTCANTQTSDIAWYTSGRKAPLFDGLGGIDFKITTTSTEAQHYFNQGMMLAYGFNHAEAARSFYEAIKLDSTAGMAYWGYAYALGPNYNGGMEDDNYQRAHKAIEWAKSLSIYCTALEVALIDALSNRYQMDVPEDRSNLDIAYAEAMEKVYEQYPQDPDVGALYADALMNLHPWDLYEKGSKEPKEWTPKITLLLEKLIAAHPKHPGAHHLYIHAVEASATPEKALASAHLLDTLVRGSGHLLHMPSHIYINTGDYHLGTLSNQRAIQVDSSYVNACHAQGVYPLAYYPHNYHFLVATAALQGNSQLAWTTSQKLQKQTPSDIMDRPEWATLQHYYSIPYYIAVKFELWDSILTTPPPAKNLTYPKLIWHYARGMAFVNKNDMANAKNEADKVRALASDSILKQLSVWEINSLADLGLIANHVLHAAITATENKIEESISLLQRAITIEDNLNYNEPPDWFFSVRHNIGALLLKTKKYREAEIVYKEDLSKWKKNGWALMGLHQSLLGQKRYGEAKIAKAAFNQAWKYADVKITSSSAVFE